MSQANPNEKPKSNDKSNRGYLANKIDMNKEIIPKNESKLSGVASRSKKNVNGKQRYSIEPIMAVDRLININEMMKIRVIVPAPANIEIILPDSSGSENNLKVTELIHINNGCLPSVKGIKRSVSTFFIT